MLVNLQWLSTLYLYFDVDDFVYCLLGLTRVDIMFDDALNMFVCTPRFAVCFPCNMRITVPSIYVLQCFQWFAVSRLHSMVLYVLWGSGSAVIV